MRVLIAFASLSGNTRDVARMVRARCLARGHAVTLIETDVQGLAAAGDDPRHDLYLLGAWSDNGGRTPPEMKRFIAALVEAVGKPERVAVFGTGETQWGEEYWCGAVRRMAAFFDTGYPRLEIEQMPHGERDALKIERWTDHVLAIAANGPDNNPDTDKAPTMQTLHAASAEDYHAAIAAHPRLLVDYFKDDCPGCRMLDMSLQKFAATSDAEGTVLLKVKLETVGEDFFRGLGLRQTPTLSLFADGAEAARLAGFQSPAQIAGAVRAHFALAPA